MAERRDCKGMTARNRPCPNPAQSDSDYCFTHDPKKAAQRAHAHARGGRRARVRHAGAVSAIPAKIRSLDDVCALLDYARAEVMVHENSLTRARVLVQMAGEYRATLAVAELEARIAAIESALSAAPAAGRNGKPVAAGAANSAGRDGGKRAPVG